ncbi:SEC-C domain-containing protein [Microcoleus sp. CAWBG58]|uniref:SEC-C domain-containing protein n=1 Tax=Microcoleus sp. CAWBG58 TaxID=2841651 RepID=UPI0025D01222|nr:SEC-C domain-containing protein [Microcoleus sp. CAWBG58]
MSIRENFKPYDLCPCQSGKKAKFCCWISKGKWNKAPTPVRVKDIGVDYAHNKCYASSTNKCSTKISREHYISHNILKEFVHERKVKITGFPWIEPETWKLLPTESLASNILCENHNQALSGLDAQMGRFFRTILDFDENFNRDNPKEELAVFSGEDIEKWMLKTVCAMVASSQLAIQGKKHDVQFKKEWVDLLYNNHFWPEYWGIYFKVPEDKTISQFKSISVEPLTGASELKKVEFSINEFKFNLILDKPDNRRDWGIYRPRTMIFSQNSVKKYIEICWQNNAYQSCVDLTRIGTTASAPPDWKQWMKQ